MPPKQLLKADLAKKQKIVEDKTFGLKNKNKSKNVQKYVQSLKQTVQPKPDPAKTAAKVPYLSLNFNFFFFNSLIYYTIYPAFYFYKNKKLTSLALC
jgi:hypothetical protein